ncbi:MAG: hypothetical protein U9O41_01870 [Candidatus Aerophobetes bacterium]|nr:hypothetical protein [Candidatus Aerophobetes bacterium]
MNRMGGFEELGKRLDKLTEAVKRTAQEGVGKSSIEAKEWGKKLDELGERVKKISQQGLERFTSGAKGLGQTGKLRLEIREIEKKLTDKFKETGEKTYELCLQKKIENPELEKLREEITGFKKEVEVKRKKIEELRKREDNL